MAGCSVDDYDRDVIKKHEKTRPDKENDRVKHLVTQSAHAEPVFLTYRAVSAIDAKVAEVTAGAPEYDFEAPDGVRHTLWLVPVADDDFFVRAFAKVPAIYVADGHHRCASASRARAALRAENPVLAPDHPVNWFPATIFPDRELAILPYNRVVKDLGGKSPGEFLAAVNGAFRIRHGTGPEPGTKGDVRMFFSGSWCGLSPIEPFDLSDPIGSLDVSVLQDRLLAPILGIGDPRTDKRIDFVGGIRGTEGAGGARDVGAGGRGVLDVPDDARRADRDRRRRRHDAAEVDLVRAEASFGAVRPSILKMNVLVADKFEEAGLEGALGARLRGLLRAEAGRGGARAAPPRDARRRSSSSGRRR